MRKMKIVAMLIATMFVGLTATSISGAVDLEADINVEIREWFGYVAPSVNISTDDQKNQSIEIEVNANYTSGVHKINDSIAINLSINDLSNRRFGIFFMPRFVIYRVILKQDPDDYLERPIFKATGYVNVVRSLLGKAEDSIKLKLGGFSIDNETLDGDPIDLYLKIQTVGFLPGNVNGHGLFDDENPIVDSGVVKLTIDYVDLI